MRSEFFLFDLIVIGAGPAGLMAAATAAAGGFKVCLIEKKKNPGRKLLMSGSGRCNLTHAGTVEDFLSRYGERERFVKPALYSFPPEELKHFFTERGVPVKELKEGKIFPESEKSSDVLNVLLKRCEENGVKLISDSPVTGIGSFLRQDGESEPEFTVNTENTGGFSASRLIIAAGGTSYPGTGSNGDGFRLAEALGHRIIAPQPALTSINIPDSPFLDLSGISLKAVMCIYRDGKLVKRRQGDLLFTHKGFSGPQVLNSSRYIEPGDQVELNFAYREPEELKSVLLSGDSGGKSVKKLLQSCMLPGRLITRVMELADVPSSLNAAELGKKRAGKLVRLFTSCRLDVDSLGGWKEAMVTRGGVDLKEVNPKTMESRLVPGLFFAGEVLDVDGDEGGYNLQFAFSSGYLAGKSVSGKERYQYPDPESAKQI